MEVELRALCQARSGDKADRSNLAVFAPNEAIYEALRREVTPDRVRSHFDGIVTGSVVRYELPKRPAPKFVMEGALGGGGPSSLRIDNLGKALGSAVLRLKVDVPEALLRDPTLPPRSPRGHVGLLPSEGA